MPQDLKLKIHKKRCPEAGDDGLEIIDAVFQSFRATLV